MIYRRIVMDTSDFLYRGTYEIQFSLNFMCKNHNKPLNKNNLNKKALCVSKNKEKRKLLQHIYNSKQWKTLRKEYIDLHPFCEKCGAPATTVHHIKKFSTGINKREIKKLAYDPDNLMSMCYSCHFKSHRKNID